MLHVDACGVTQSARSENPDSTGFSLCQARPGYGRGVPGWSVESGAGPGAGWLRVSGHLVNMDGSPRMPPNAWAAHEEILHGVLRTVF